MMQNLSSIYIVEHLYMFRAYLQSTIRRYTVWIQQLVLIILFRRLSVVLVGDNRESSKRTVSTKFYIQTVYFLMVGCRYTRNM